MKIGIVPETCSGGGSYLYSLLLLDTLSTMPSEEFVAFLEAPDEVVDTACSFAARAKWPRASLRQRIQRRAQNIAPLRVSIQLCDRALRSIKTDSSGQRSSEGIRDNGLRQTLHGLGVHFMIYAYPTTKSFESGIPFMMPVHDLQHRLQPHFPEVSAGGEWERREYLFGNAIRGASVILADSEIGKEDILTYYGGDIDPAQIEVLPYPPIQRTSRESIAEEIVRVRAKYKLPERYLFYPAQFWPHKNHERVVRAIAQLKEGRRATIHVVFSGSHSGAIRQQTFYKVMETARQLGVENEVTSLGYVPDSDVAPLYAGAEALVMPTFFGPTNIPILEAWTIGCPVLTSDIRGLREQAGNAALLVDPESTEAIADGIYRLWTEDSTRQTLARLGAARVRQFTVEDFKMRFRNVVATLQDRIQEGGLLCTSH